MENLNFSNQLGITTIIELNNKTIGCIESKDGRFLVSIKNKKGNYADLNHAKREIAELISDELNTQLIVTNK